MADTWASACRTYLTGKEATPDATDADLMTVARYCIGAGLNDPGASIEDVVAEAMLFVAGEPFRNDPAAQVAP